MSASTVRLRCGTGMLVGVSSGPRPSRPFARQAERVRCRSIGQNDYRTTAPERTLAERCQSKTPQIDMPEVLPLIPLRDLILFPNLVVPLFVGRERSINALEEAMREDHLVALVTQREAELQDPGHDDIYEIGCVASIMQELKLPDGTAKALVEGQQRFRIVEWIER